MEIGGGTEEGLLRIVEMFENLGGGRRRRSHMPTEIFDSGAEKISFARDNVIFDLYLNG